MKIILEDSISYDTKIVDFGVVPVNKRISEFFIQSRR